MRAFPSSGRLRHGDATVPLVPALSTEKLSTAPIITDCASKGLHRYHKNLVICLSLHAGLVLIHAALLAVASGHYEHAATWDLNTFSKTWLPLIITVSSQTFGTVSSLCITALVHALTRVIFSDIPHDTYIRYSTPRIARRPAHWSDSYDCSR